MGSDSFLPRRPAAIIRQLLSHHIMAQGPGKGLGQLQL